MDSVTNCHLKKVSYVLYAISALFYFLGANKAYRYENPEYFGDKINAYVGGDAYNYIINSNFATGYYVLCVGFMIVATLLLCTYFILRKMESTAEQESGATTEALSSAPEISSDVQINSEFIEQPLENSISE